MLIFVLHEHPTTSLLYNNVYIIIPQIYSPSFGGKTIGAVYDNWLCTNGQTNKGDIIEPLVKKEIYAQYKSKIHIYIRY